MKTSRAGALIALLTSATIGLAACSSDAPEAPAPGGDESAGGGASAPAQVSGTLTGGGASSQEAAMTAWTQGVTSVQPELQVQYNPVGSGSGREGFLAGQYTFAGSDAAMDSEEYTQSQQICGPDGAFHVPAYISPVAVAYNLPSLTEPVNMDADTIARVFTGEITTWNDPAIAEQNEGVELPSTGITVVHRADSSGTTENFTDYLTAAAPEAWTYDVVEDWPADIAAENAQGTSGVVNLVSQTEGAITYADASAIGDLGSVAVQVGEEYVPYSAEAAAAAVEASEKVGGGAPNDMAVELDRTSTEAGTYPIVLVSYHIYCSAYADQETADQVKAFGTYVVSEDGQAASAEAAGSAPLSPALSEEATAAIEAITVQ
ncbi:phosphate ABC transporter substrate-binding protein PstS [Desertihabitans brevis]|uniref:Phosphate-binding protein n=1 Tax=Desertihabitans brevis TaxID=2268447 RepID=A0A367YTN7_9ACTN|nr:phosphate ABC transporter substrate-binding protein PstS [Desertihabitans brevis]RCK69117.1 phosphate ABC transporter substrate-binding protein PstS [Desertihabitans brevis]